MQSIASYFLLFVIYSFLGWCLEVGVKLYEDHKFVNRGFLIGPYCPIYGFGAVFMSIFLQRYLEDPLALFILIVVSCSILEYTTSYILEKLFHTRWWDYTNRKFHINGRICLETMFLFAAFGMLVMYVVTPFFLHLFQQISPNILILLAGILFFCFVLDCVVSFSVMNQIKNVSKTTQEKQLLFKDDTERTTKLVRKEIAKSKKKLQNRILESFPNALMLKFKKRKKP
ncbi:MAG: putative ABC transporter permease [Bacilli bacterium]|nr:putative ABC transporter permease [Bacilli bacterium]